MKPTDKDAKRPRSQDKKTAATLTRTAHDIFIPKLGKREDRQRCLDLLKKSKLVRDIRCPRFKPYIFAVPDSPEKQDAILKLLQSHNFVDSAATQEVAADKTNTEATTPSVPEPSKDPDTMDVDESSKQAPDTPSPHKQPTSDGAPQTPAGPQAQQVTTGLKRKKTSSGEAEDRKKSKLDLQSDDEDDEDDDEDDEDGLSEDDANNSTSSTETVVHNEANQKAPATLTGASVSTEAPLNDANVSVAPITSH
jgi:hypothetical protein